MRSDFSSLDARLQRTLPQARLQLYRPDGLAEIELALINHDFPTGPLPADVMQAVIAEPAYWSFCWGSGIALARHLLDNPEVVAGRDVVDLGSGSGVAAIAAAMAGASAVVACDLDADARLAAEINAAHNGVSVTTTETLPEHADLIVMADVLYDAANLPLLAEAQAHADEILVADSRVTTLPDPSYMLVRTIPCLTYPNLGEFDEFNLAHLFGWAAPARSAS